MPASHGTKKKHRHPGSIGAGKTLGRVFKGLKMAGHMGAKTVTTVGLEVVEVRADDNVILIKGAVPGPNGSMVVVKGSARKGGA